MSKSHNKKFIVATTVVAAMVGAFQAQAEPAEGGHGDPFTPVGSLQVTPTVVQPGVQPNMWWAIDYPKMVADLVSIIPPGRLITINEKKETLQVRVAGSSFNSTDGTELPVALWIRVNGNPWELIFYGTESTVDASSFVYEVDVLEGAQINFAARGRSSSGSWYPTRSTFYDTPNIEALVNGDPIPEDSSALNNGSAESFMTQFIDDDSEIVASPRDILYLFELASSEPGSEHFDMQDLVAVVSFKDKNNNGHGNNLDGFDSSNMGSSTGVGGVGDTNTATDDDGKTYYFIDDEGKRIKKK